MALQVWLPLDNNIKNLGLKNVTCTKLGTVNFEDGKIGKAFSRGSTRITDGVRLNTNFLDMFNGSKKCTVAVWVKPAGNHVNYNGTILSSGNWNNKRWAFGLSQDNSKVDVFCNSYNTYVNCAVPVGEWTHLVSVYDNRVCKLYKNGVYVASYTASSDFDSDAQITCVGRETYANGYFGFNGMINDLRIYDHCLSAKEIKEISQGLTVHFPLDFNEYKLTSCTNLVKNGWRGIDNWNSSAGIYTDDLPNVTGITQRYGSKFTKEYIEINQDHEYQYSAYVKKIPNSTATRCYLALEMFDSDKLVIKEYQTASVFRTNTKTTLAQDLNPGDTVVHLTSASNWKASKYIAIFGYTNSEGYTYPDYIYTRNIKSYTTVDTTNNTITLSATYDGTTVIPAGTAICQTVAASPYYYPWSASSSTVEDWTLASSTFIPKDKNILKAVKYVRVYTMGGYNYTAGCTLVDLTEGTTVYDSSGFGNNGTITGNMQIDPKSPRYETCMQPLTDNSYISFPTRKFQEFTYSFWVKRDRLDNWDFIATSWNGLYISIWQDPDNKILFRQKINNSNFDLTSTTHINDTTKWYHIACTRDSSGLSKLYVNGILEKSNTNANPISYENDNTDLGRYSNYQFLGSISDFRIYATALSENEIKELYDTSTIIDNKGTLHTFEILENSENLLKYENCLKYTNPANTSTRGKIVMRNGTPAMAFKATDTYPATYSHMLEGFFKENTRYIFGFWLDTDDMVYNGTNRSGGFYVDYTDGTHSVYSDLTVIGDASTPKGFQHKLYISTSGKSVKKIRIYYDIGTTFYLRGDSFITEIGDTDISKTGIVDTGQFIEGTEGSLDAQAIIYRGGMESNSITEI